MSRSFKSMTDQIVLPGYRALAPNQVYLKEGAIPGLRIPKGSPHTNFLISMFRYNDLTRSAALDYLQKKAKDVAVRRRDKELGKSYPDSLLLDLDPGQLEKIASGDKAFLESIGPLFKPYEWAGGVKLNCGLVYKPFLELAVNNTAEAVMQMFKLVSEFQGFVTIDIALEKGVLAPKKNLDVLLQHPVPFSNIHAIQNNGLDDYVVRSIIDSVYSGLSDGEKTKLLNDGSELMLTAIVTRVLIDGLRHSTGSFSTN